MVSGRLRQLLRTACASSGTSTAASRGLWIAVVAGVSTALLSDTSSAQWGGGFGWGNW